MRIKDFPKNGRPRERFLERGPEALSDAELFAIILRTGTVNENVVDMSNRLISKYGLNGLFECSLKELQKIKGIGQGKAMQILTMFELGKRYSMSKKIVTKISKPQDVFDYFKDNLKGKKQEHFYILMLNTQNNIIGERLISKGILDASIIHSREIFRPAIRNSCSKIVLVHNHPSGNPKPSDEDLEITEKLVDVGKQLDIRVLDHVIVGEGKFWSWGERD